MTKQIEPIRDAGDDHRPEKTADDAAAPPEHASSADDRRCDCIKDQVAAAGRAVHGELSLGADDARQSRERRAHREHGDAHRRHVDAGPPRRFGVAANRVDVDAKWRPLG